MTETSVNLLIIKIRIMTLFWTFACFLSEMHPFAENAQETFWSLVSKWTLTHTHKAQVHEALYWIASVTTLSGDEMKTWICSSVLPLDTCKFDLCHQGRLWNRVAAQQIVPVLRAHTNASVTHSLSLVMGRKGGRRNRRGSKWGKQPEKLLLQRKVNILENWIVLTFSEYLIYSVKKG